MITTKELDKGTYRSIFPPMDFEIVQENARVPVTIFRPLGRINLGNTERMIEKAKEVFANGSRHLIIDLSSVPSITSAGLRAIQRIYQLFGNEIISEDGKSTSQKTEEAKQKFVPMKLLNPNPDVRRTLNLAGFASFIEIYDNSAEALLSF